MALSTYISAITALALLSSCAAAPKLDLNALQRESDNGALGSHVFFKLDGKRKGARNSRAREVQSYIHDLQSHIHGLENSVKKDQQGLGS